VVGFLVKPSVRQLMDETVGLTEQRALEEASFDADLIWQAWTVRLNESAILLVWLVLYASVGVAVAAAGPARHTRSSP
jgi:hypothetical protein